MGTKPVKLPLWFRAVVVFNVGLVVSYLAYLSVLRPSAALVALPILLIPYVVRRLIMGSDIFGVGQRQLYNWAVMVGAGWLAVLALTVNTFVYVLSGELTATLIGAPLVEEVLKCAAVAALLRAGARGPLTAHAGASVGALVGAGFALTEDIGYVLNSHEPVTQMMLRLLIGPFFHSATAALYGMVIARGASSVIVVAALSVGVAAHGMWNTVAQLDLPIYAALAMSTSVTVGFVYAWWLSEDQQHRSWQQMLAEGSLSGTEIALFAPRGKRGEKPGTSPVRDPIICPAVTEQLMTQWRYLVAKFCDETNENRREVTHVQLQVLRSTIAETCSQLDGTSSAAVGRNAIWHIAQDDSTVRGHHDLLEDGSAVLDRDNDPQGQQRTTSA